MTGTQVPTVRRFAFLLLGISALLVGLYVLLRPFTSFRLLVLLIGLALIVTGAARAVEEEGAAPRLIGGVTAIAGAAALMWPQVTVRGVLIIVAGWLVVDGLADITSAVRRTAQHATATVIHGAASIIFGVLTLLWPDVSLLIIGLAFAFKLISFGLSRISAVIRRDGTKQRRQLTPVTSAVLTLVLALGLAGVSFMLRMGAPVVDGFYTPPAAVPDRPGALIRSEPFARGVPDAARAWRILYTTTRDEGVPAVASGIVVAPSTMGQGSPVVAWTHGTTGVDRSCAPSVLPDPFGAGALFIADEVVDEGWVLVATDYVGLGTEGPHPYMIGQGQGRSALDAVRAAREMPELTLSDATVVWGHSQGGHAALWTGAIAPTYAPDVDLIGVAALAPASDLLALVSVLEEMPGGNIFASFIAVAYAAHFPDLDLNQYVDPAGQITMRALASRCLAEPAVFTSILSSLVVNWSMFTGDMTQGSLSRHLEDNTPPFTVAAPLFLGQGADDSLIKREMQDGYVSRMCAADQDVEYRVYPGRNHVPLVEADSPLIPDLIEWTHARLRGVPPMSTCH